MTRRVFGRVSEPDYIYGWGWFLWIFSGFTNSFLISLHQNRDFIWTKVPAKRHALENLFAIKFLRFKGGVRERKKSKF